MKLHRLVLKNYRGIEHREIETAGDIVLLGTVDLNTMLRHMLEQVATRVTAFIVAPESLADRFDAHGCLVPAAWCTASIPLSDQPSTNGLAAGLASSPWKKGSSQVPLIAAA